MISRLFLIILFCTAANWAYAQTGSDSTEIRNTALDYIEGWYAGEEERMERAIHPRLAKRLVAENPQQGNSYLVVTSALELVQQTQRGGGKRYLRTIVKRRLKFWISMEMQQV